MKLLVISAVSWVAGLAAYVVALGVLWHESLRAGDLRAVVFGSAVASAVAISIVYAPVMFALRRRIPSTAAWWSFPVVSICLGILPVIVIVALFGGNLRSRSSPEAVLFYCMFATFGLVFGVGFFLAYGRSV
jgi:hypothetical protein